MLSRRLCFWLLCIIGLVGFALLANQEKSRLRFFGGTRRTFAKQVALEPSPSEAKSLGKATAVRVCSSNPTLDKLLKKMHTADVPVLWAETGRVDHTSPFFTTTKPWLITWARSTSPLAPKEPTPELYISLHRISDGDVISARLLISSDSASQEKDRSEVGRSWVYATGDFYLKVYSMNCTWAVMVYGQ